jgi:hypothetical protein
MNAITPAPNQEARDIEQLAIALRQAAFPGAEAWPHCSQYRRKRWIAAATLAYERIKAARNPEEHTDG